VFKKILVPLDGSRFAEQALPAAVVLAEQAGATLQLALVHHQVPNVALAVDVPIYDVQADAEMRARETAYLDEVARRLRDTTRLDIATVALEGAAAEALAQHAERERADLVILATHGRGPVSRFWLGSVADYLLRHLPMPVLLIRARERAGAPEALPLRRILVPLDRSTVSEAVLEPVSTLAQLTQGHIALLHVAEPLLPIIERSTAYPAIADRELNQRLVLDAQVYLDRVAERLRAQGHSVSTQVVQGIGVAATILEHAADIHADLVAMATHGATGVRRLLLGSVTDKVVRGADRPVLTCLPGR